MAESTTAPSAARSNPMALTIDKSRAAWRTVADVHLLADSRHAVRVGAHGKTCLRCGLNATSDGRHGTDA